jgi:hypothetical protein
MPTTRLYEDVPAEIIERDEGLGPRSLKLHGTAWHLFLNRMLPPVPSGPTDTARALHSPEGMADFLLTQGRSAADDLSGALAGQGSFWQAVRSEVEHLTHR